jgi:AAHS family 4-hydroxybenzoate transporter-like MFS transporter
MSRSGLIVLALLGAAIMILDGYDLQVIALVVPLISKAWEIAPSSFGWVMTMPVFGLGAGALLIAPLGDRFGRRKLILMGVLLVSFAVGASALVQDLWALGALRFLTGLALGMTLPNLTALVAELAPARIRSGLLTVISLGISFGALGSGLVVPRLLPAFGWQGAFLCSAIAGLVFLVLLFFLLPEAPSFLSRDTSAAAVAARPPREPFWKNYAALLAPEYRQRTLALWILWICNAFMLYIVSSWLPTLLAKSGWDVTGASHSVAWFQGGGMAGGLVIAALMDRWRPRGALIGAYVACASGILLLGWLGTSNLSWSIAFALIGVGVGGMNVALNAVCVMLYPSRILSTGIGSGVAVGRLGAIGGPLVGAWLIGQGMSARGVLMALIPAVAICILCVAWMPLRRAANTAGGQSNA